MPNLIIRFIYEPGIVSKLIAWQTNSLWCHTEALSEDGMQWIGAHARTGVQARPLTWCTPLRERRYRVNVDAASYARAHKWLRSKIGTPYNYEDIAGLALHWRIGFKKRAIICSALMTDFLNVAGLEPLNVLPKYSYLITPETLHMSKIFIGRCVYSRGV